MTPSHHLGGGPVASVRVSTRWYSRDTWQIEISSAVCHRVSPAYPPRGMEVPGPRIHLPCQRFIT